MPPVADINACPYIVVDSFTSTQPLVESTYTKVTDYASPSKTTSAATPSILELFLASVQLFVAKV